MEIDLSSEIDHNKSPTDHNDDDDDETTIDEKPVIEKKKDDPPIILIAVDPGIVHHAIIRILFRGFKYKNDTKTNQLVKIPDYDILNWEHWDLKRRITYKMLPDGTLKTSKYGGNNELSEDRLRWDENMALFIASADWLFEKDEYGNLAPIVTEIQPGYIKNEEVDVYTISRQLTCAVKSHDIKYHNCQDRKLINAAKKYGIPSDGSLNYRGRKDKSDEVTFNILEVTGKKEAITFLQLVPLAQKRDVPNRYEYYKTDDLSDCHGLGLEQGARICEERDKLDDNAIELEEEPIRITIFDDDEDEALLDMKIRKKKRKEKIESIASDHITKIKRNRKRKNLEEESDDDDNPTSKKKRKTKK
jgi:hypothetical protein